MDEKKHVDLYIGSEKTSLGRCVKYESLKYPLYHVLSYYSNPENPEILPSVNEKTKRFWTRRSALRYMEKEMKNDKSDPIASEIFEMIDGNSYLGRRDLPKNMTKREIVRLKKRSEWFAKRLDPFMTSSIPGARSIGIGHKDYDTVLEERFC